MRNPLLLLAGHDILELACDYISSFQLRLMLNTRPPGGSLVRESEREVAYRDVDAGIERSISLHVAQSLGDSRAHFQDIHTDGQSRSHFGHHFGDQIITNQYYNNVPTQGPTERQKKPPPLILPFARDRKFIGREDTLSSIDLALGQDSNVRRAALTGLGGVG